MKQKTVIVGGGLTGLALTHALHKRDHDVILLEATEKLGGRFRGDSSELSFAAPSEQALSALEWLKSMSPASLHWSEAEHQPLIFESGEWRPFLGFGDFPSSVVNELSFFNQSKQWVIEPGFDQIARSFIEQLPIEARLLNEVTGFECADGKVTAVVVNAQEKIAADKFIFSPSPHLLNTLLPGDALKPATRTRLAKQTGWTASILTLLHREPVDTSSAIRFVLGSGKEFEPVVGRVWPTHSVWVNLVSSEREEDLEHVGDCVRFIKRTLKRVWPELLDLTKEEKIRIRPQACGQLDLKLKNGAFPELPNLYVGDPRLSGVPHEIGTAAMAEQLSALFVAQPKEPVLSPSDLTNS